MFSYLRKHSSSIPCRSQCLGGHQERGSLEKMMGVAEGVGVEGGNQEEREGWWRGLGHSLGEGRAAGTPVGYGRW